MRLFFMAAALLALSTTFTMGGCASHNPYYDPARSHHTPEGFRNNYPPDPAYRRPDIGFFEGWSKRLSKWTASSETYAPRRALETVAPDRDFIRANNGGTPSLTWIGHATFLLQNGRGLTILTDPVFDERASPVSFAGPKRHQPPGVSLEDLPHIDAVIISHSHYDHLSRASLKAIYGQKGGPPMIYAPLGVDRWIAENVTDGDTSHIVKLDWWDKTSLKGIDIQLLPVQHWSARSLWDRNETLWGVYAIQWPDFSFFFSGDLGYSKDIADIAQRFDGFDLAAIGVGAYNPVWYRNSHVTPEEALRIHKELRIKRSVGMHWGTFPMGDERLDQAADDLEIAREQQGISEQEFLLMRHGETLKLPE
jgi:N-acyl-phosphatidylethanolamine-hydrolysing phospholipase D